MVSFKISYGKESNLPQIIKNGNMYFCTDTGNLFIDHLSERIHVNAHKAQMLTYFDEKTNKYIDIDAKTLLELSNGGSADWNQNDPEAKDYVKNRTHYVDSVIINNEYPNGILEELVSERTGEHIYKISNDVFDIQNGFYGTIVAEIKDVDCTFNINGEDFLEGPSKSTFRTIEHNESCLGLQIRYDQGAAARIGEFLIVISDSYEYATRLDTWILSRGIWVNNGIIKSVSAIKSIMQLDERFIPDTIARKSDILGSEQSSDWNQNDETAPDYIKNRTHWEEGSQTVMRASADTVLDVVQSDGSDFFYRVSEATPTWDDLIGATLEISDDEGTDSAVLTEDFLAFCRGQSTETFMALLNERFMLYVACVDNVEVDGVIFPKKGVYAFKSTVDRGAICTLTYGSTTVHKLDPKFLPEGGFGWEENGKTVIEWDGTTEGKEMFNDYVKISNLTPSVSELAGATVKIVTTTGETFSETIEEDDIEEENGVISIRTLQVFVILDAEAAGTSIGVYVRSTYYYDISAFTITLGSTTTIIHPIDDKFIPDTIARKEDVLNGASSKDWNQNDPTQPDYIKNRTHWVGSDQTVIEWNSGGEYVAVEDLIKISDLTPSVSELIGAHCYYTINDEQFEFVFTENDVGDYIEEQGYINWPFGIIAIDPPELAGTYVYSGLENEGFSNLHFAYGSIVYHQLDPKFIDFNPKYIKDMYYDIISTQTVPETTVEFNIDKSDFVEGAIDIELFVGNNYTVTWNGIKYECVCYTHDGTPVIGNDACWDGTGGNGEPFLVSNYDGITAINVYESGSYTISISGLQREFNQIDEKFIPDSVKLPVVTTENNGAILQVVDGVWTASEINIPEQAQPDWAQNDPDQSDYIKNRTHWFEEKQTVIDWDSTKEYETPDSTICYKIFDQVPTKKQLTNASVKRVSLTGEVVEYTIAADNFVDFNDACYGFVDNNGEFERIRFYTQPHNEILSAGAYFIVDEIETLSYISITFDSSVYHQLDKQFIPESATAKDWNQNDPSESNYIKNRTHYTIPEYHYDLFSVLGIQFSEDKTASGKQCWSATAEVKYEAEEEIIELVPDTEYEFEFEYFITEQGYPRKGQYTGVMKRAADVLGLEHDGSENGLLYLGNFSFIVGTKAPDTGEDYCVVFIQIGGRWLSAIRVIVCGNLYNSPSGSCYLRGATAKHKTIADWFIPDTIARVSDIPNAIVNAETVKVGQTIRVKHINVSGKIEWEAVDFPEADLSAYYTKAEIDSLLNGYIAEVDAIIG